MSNRIKGITVEIGGDVTGLSKALGGVNKEIKSTQSQLKDVEKLLKLDPTNTNLLQQRQRLLAQSVEETKAKLESLKEAEKQVQQQVAEGKASQEQYEGLQREIISTEQELANLEQASNSANATLSKIGATADKVASGAEKIASATKGLSAAAAGAIVGIGGMAYSAVTSADDLNTLAKQSGFTTAELQKMQYAQDLIDTSMEDITSSAQKLKKNMGSTSDSVTSAFQQLGVSVTDANGKMRSSTDVYWDVISALGQVRNETERDQLAMTLLGRGADSLAGIIDDGGAAFRALGQEAEATGLILSQDTLDSLNAVNDKIDATKAKAQATLAASGAKAMEALMPVLDVIVEAVGKALDAIGQMDEGQIKLILTVLSVVAAISPISSIVSNIASGVSFFTESVLPALSSMLSFIAANPIVLVIAAVVAMAAAIAVKGDEMQAKLQQFDDFMQGVFARDWTEVFGPVLGGILNDFFSAFKVIWDSIMQVLNGVIDIIRGVFTGNWERAWNGVKEVFSGIFHGLYTIAMAPLNGIISMINSIIDGINWVISGINSIPGFSLGSLGRLPMLANGGTLYSGSAIVGEAGPELLTVSGGRAVVQPLSANTGRIEGQLGNIAGLLSRSTGTERPIVVEVTLDGEVIGRTAVNYSNRRSRSHGS